MMECFLFQFDTVSKRGNDLGKECDTKRVIIRNP